MRPKSVHLGKGVQERQEHTTKGLKDAKICAGEPDIQMAICELIGCYAQRDYSMRLDDLGIEFRHQLRREMVAEFCRIREQTG